MAGPGDDAFRRICVDWNLLLLVQVDELEKLRASRRGRKPLSAGPTLFELACRLGLIEARTCRSLEALYPDSAPDAGVAIATRRRRTRASRLRLKPRRGLASGVAIAVGFALLLLFCALHISLIP
jgi:hypothetical protein